MGHRAPEAGKIKTQWDQICPGHILEAIFMIQNP